ncbi:Glycoside hydrolase superfamily [Lactarius tabidus]
MKFVSKHGLDGIEFDWEFPNKQGIGCNSISANDSANFLSFLQKFRNQPGAQNLFVSAAVPTQPFIGPNYNPLKNVTGFAEVLDYIEIMSYNNWGSLSSAFGPNSALDDSCAPLADQQDSAISAVKAWSKAGFPISRMILGVPAFGHSYRVSKSSALNSSGNIQLYAPFNKADQPPGDRWDIAAGSVDACGNPTVTGGIFNFWGLIEAGFLKDDGTVASGIEYDFDDCSKTPYVYNATSEVMVSFDDATSFAAKGQYIGKTGLGGFIMWQAGGDHNDILLDAIKSAVDAS